ncbi:MAG: outer membrane lipoprotein carrier protein LolA [Gammaproteobacteria bacterium]|nr:outer membrane lipoprotein carrier protein LolA [Gammaproteobacteria bacterium]
MNNLIFPRLFIMALAFNLSFLSITPAHAADSIDVIFKQLKPSDLAKGEFLQKKHIAVLKQPLISEGDFLFDTQYGVLWHTIKPFENKLIITKNKIMPANDPRQAIPLPAGFGELLPALISGRFKSLQNDFTIEAVKENQGWRATLTPINAGLKSVLANIEISGAAQPAVIKLKELNGDVTEIQLRNLSQPKALTDAERKIFELVK